MGRRLSDWERASRDREREARAAARRAKTASRRGQERKIREKQKAAVKRAKDAQTARAATPRPRRSAKPGTSAWPMRLQARTAARAC